MSDEIETARLVEPDRAKRITQFCGAAA